MHADICINTHTHIHTHIKKAVNHRHGEKFVIDTDSVKQQMRKHKLQQNAHTMHAHTYIHTHIHTLGYQRREISENLKTDRDSREQNQQT
jgi:hypothetical protein